MKIMHIETEKNWRGGQQQAYYLIKGLQDSGVDVCMACPEDSVTLQRMMRENIDTLPIRYLSEIDFVSALKIAGFARKHKYQIVHAHSAHALSLGLMVKIFYPSVKLVASRRVDFHINQRLFARYKYQNNLLDKIICISGKIHSVLLEDGISGDKLVTIHSGIDTNKKEIDVDRAELMDKWNIPDKALMVCTVAAFAGHKDYPTLIRAAKIVCEQNPEVYFLAIGDGSLFEEMAEQVRKNNLSDRFILCGFVPDVHNFLAAADIFVLSSKKEGLGTSVLDAQVYGLPVIATNAGGIPEMIENGINGIIVPTQNPQVLAEAISNLSTDEQKRKELSDNASRIVKRFDISVTLHKHLNLYQSLLLNE